MTESRARPASDIAPRIVRFRDAPRYLGMDRNRFNAEVRPQLTEVPIGKQVSIGLNSTHGSRTISPATGVPHGKEQSHGTQKNPRPHLPGRSLACRQTHLRAANLPKHWNS